MPVAGGGATITREIRWLITARDMSRVGLNSAIIALEQLGLAATQVNYKMMLAGTGMVVASGLIIKGLMNCVEAAAELDQGLRNIQAISRDLTEGDLAAMGDQLLDLSMKYPYSAKQMTDALYMIYSAEYEGVDATTMLEASLAAASAGMTSVETAGTALISILKGYGLSAQDSTAVMDKMFNAVDIGIFRFDDLAKAFGKIIPMAYTMNIPLEQILASYVVMSNKGLDLANAQTYLNRAMVAFAKPSEDMVFWLNSMGYESGQVYLATRGIPGLIEDLTGKFKLQNVVMPETIKNTDDYNEVMQWLATTTTVDVTELAKLFPTIQGLRGILALITGDTREFTDALTKIAGDTGTTMAALEKQQAGYEYQLQIFKNTIDVIKIKIGQALLPELKNMIVGWQEWISELLKSSPDIGKTVAEIGKIAVAALGLGGVFLILKSITGSAIKTILGMFMSLYGAIGLWTIPLVLFVGAVATNFDEMKYLIFELKDVFVSLGKVVMDIVSSVLGVFADLFGWLDRIGALIPMITGFIGALIGLKVIFPIIVTLIGFIQTLYVRMMMLASGEILQAFGRVANAATAATGPMASLGATVGGSMAMGIQIGTIAIAGIAMAIWGAVSAHNRWLEELNKIREKASETSATMLNELIPAVEDLESKISDLNKTGGDTTQVQNDLQTAINNVAAACPTAIIAINKLTGAYEVDLEYARQLAIMTTNFGPATDKVRSSVGDLVQNYTDMSTGIDENVAALEGLRTRGDEIRQVMVGMGMDAGFTSQLVGDLTKALEQGGEEGSSAFKVLDGAIGEYIQTITASGGYTIEEINNLYALQDQVKWLGSGMIDTVNKYGGSTIEMQIATENLKKAMGETWNTMALAAKNAGAQMEAATDQMISAWTSDIPITHQLGIDLMTEYFNSMFSTLGVQSPNLNAEISAMVNEIMDKSDLSTKQGRDNVMAYVETMISHLGLDTDQAEKLRKAVQALINSAGEAGGTTASSIGYDIGLKLAQGLYAGFTPTLSSIGSSISTLMRSLILLKMMEAVDAESPSKKTMYIGEMMAKGLQIGLENGIADVNRAAFNLVNGSISTSMARASSIGQTLAGTSGGTTSNTSNTKVIHIDNVNLPNGTDGKSFISDLELEVNRMGG